MIGTLACMTLALASSAALAEELDATPPAAAPAPPVGGPATARVPVAFDLVPLVGASSVTRGHDLRHLSLNLVGGYSGAVQGAEVASAFNITRKHVRGLQVAGAANLVTGPVQGLQASGALNVAAGAVRGGQVAGAVNAAGDVTGAQLAGAVNVAEDVHGVQASGALNVAHGDVHGVQVGVVNVARESDLSIGLISVVTHGRTHLDVWATESGLASVAIKHGGEHWHNLYTVGADISGGTYSMGLGFGGHAPTTRRTWVDGEVLSQQLRTECDCSFADLNMLQTARAVGGLSLAPGLAVTAGLSYNVLVADTDLLVNDAGMRRLMHYGDSVQVWGWPGVVVGIELLPGDRRRPEAAQAAT